MGGSPWQGVLWGIRVNGEKEKEFQDLLKDSLERFFQGLALCFTGRRPDNVSCSFPVGRAHTEDAVKAGGIF